ncbi:MAG: helix-hairpin-helix domain-containing protein, partial [Candidatus Thermoplasmatota archaeon]|nr:helix-hairpin-helix domain-containing protein [Candidatus Thermoplasmatota archaeon]
MDPANEPVADLLNEIANILEITGTDRFRPLAYRKAARTVEALPKPVSDYISEGRLSDLSGIGEAIAAKITEFVRNGKLEYLENLRKGIPSGLLEMLKLQDVGPKTVARLFAELKITSIDELQKACEE